MLNTTTGAPSTAGPMAAYLLAQAIKSDLPDHAFLLLGTQVHNGELEYHIAMERLIADDTATLQDELRDRLDGLRTAFAASGEGAFAKAVDGLSKATDAPEFDRLADGLAVAVAASAQSEWYRSVQKARETHADLHDRALIVDQASSRLAFSLYRAENPEPDLTAGVRYRQDTDPRLAALLGFDPNAIPTKSVIANLMRAHDASDRRIPGKMYRSANAISEPVGYQAFVFTATKDVSVVWALGTIEEKALALSAHRAAISETMSHIADLIGLVRSGDGGKQTERAHITWIEFDHPTARRTSHPDADPNLHSHVIVPGSCLSETRDKVGSLYTLRLHDAMRPLRMIYEKSLAANLTARGIEATYHPDRKDVTLDAIPVGISTAFSKRREEAKLSAREWLDKHDISIDRLSPEQLKQHISRAVVAGTRREDGAKRHDTPTPPNPVSWHRQVRELGWRLTHVISDSFRMAQRLAVQDRLARKLTHGSGIELEAGHSQFRGHLIEEDDLLRPPSLRL